MPINQQPSATGSQSPGASRGQLVRSKSLRLPSSKSKTEQPATSTLTRHGSIRQTKAQSAANAKPLPFSVLRKPQIKPKPVFGSKSTENLSMSRPNHTVDNDLKKQSSSCRSPTKSSESHHLAKGVTFQSDGYSTLSDSPSSFRSDKSQQSRDAWNMPDLAVHLKRLTEEHEKLQVEYARVRMHLLDSIPSNPVASLKKELQHLSHSDSHLASIPENLSGSGFDDKTDENSANSDALLQVYRTEILKLQEENRKLQRKYWEQVLSTESIEDELNGGASQQVVELIDKLDDKQRELLQSSNRVQELVNHLATTTLELHQCQDALQDYQHMLEEASIQKDKLEKQLKETATTLLDVQENVEFLQEERSTLAEALQETEQALAMTQAEKKICDTRLNDLMNRARKLYVKVQDKTMQIQLLQAELDRTQGQARDMLLSQGAELTMTSMNLSEISIALHSILNSASDFAANELELQKEMLEDIMADLDDESDKNGSSDSPQIISPLENLCEPFFKVPDSEALPKDFISEAVFSDVHKSLPDLSAGPVHPSSALNSASSNGSGQVSIVQSIIQAVEGTSRKAASKPSSLRVSSPDGSSPNSIQSSSENLVSASENYVAKISCSRTGAFKPVGTAIPFRPVVQNNQEHSSAPAPPAAEVAAADEDIRKASLESQLNQLNVLMGKLNKVMELTQGKYMTKMEALKEEITRLQGELKHYKEVEKNLLLEVKFKSSQVSSSNVKLLDSTNELKNAKKSFSEEKEEFLKQLSEVREENKCLEAVNKEQANQLKEEVHSVVESALKKHNTVHFSDALAICDKLSLKQEICRLKEKISQKEQLLQALAQKFAKTKKVLEENLQKADNEVECLDKVIGNVHELLRNHPELVKSSDIVKSIFDLVSSLPEELRDAYKKDAVTV